MNNQNSGREYINCYEDEHGSTKNKNYNFDFDIDINESDECFINDVEKNDNKDFEELFKEGFQEGFTEGYEKAIQEILIYMKKNKCCIKCKRKSNLKSINKNKYFKKCKHS